MIASTPIVTAYCSAHPYTHLCLYNIDSGFSVVTKTGTGEGWNLTVPEEYAQKVAAFLYEACPDTALEWRIGWLKKIHLACAQSDQPGMVHLQPSVGQFLHQKLFAVPISQSVLKEFGRKWLESHSSVRRAATVT
ncbi:hypothetical protein ACLUTX_12455 [Enterobacterales bacterium AE_CKDN230030158-1A_HGKHYDSX7]